MKIVIVPDKFKGSLDATQVCNAIKEGILAANQQAEIIAKPLADGGDGVLEVLLQYTKSEIIQANVQDPLGRPIVAEYGFNNSSGIAIIEMAKASGLLLLSESERDAMITSSFGTGELIADAIKRGAKKIILGIGGSATNDAGIGAAAALGYSFYDQAGDTLEPIGKNLAAIHSYSAKDIQYDLNSIEFLIACDVSNPFYGEQGAAAVYGPQKGLSSLEIAELDKGLQNIANVIKKQSGLDVQNIAGAGAAGGLGGGAKAFFGAQLKPGIDLVIDICDVEQDIAAADLVVTGEGCIDEQTLNGKVIAGVTSIARKYAKKVAVLCGSQDVMEADIKLLNVDYISSIVRDEITVDEAIANANTLLKERAFEMANHYR